MDNERNHFIDILKGICILFVIITHFPWEADERLKLLFPFWIGMAVPVFMIISGYVNTLSFERNGIAKIGDAYQSSMVVSKVLRYTIPFAMVFLLEMLSLYIEGRWEVSAKSLLVTAKWFLIGGKGPGSYYYPILIQLIFLLPIIYFIVRKFGFKGVVLCGLINGAYEVLQYAYGMNEECSVTGFWYSDIYC